MEKDGVQLPVKPRLEELSKQLIEESRDFVREFQKDFVKDAQFEAELNPQGPSSVSGVDTKRILKWTSSAAGAASAIAFTLVAFGLPNAWNPVGWALLGISALTFVASGFFPSRASKIAKKQKEAIQQLQTSIDENQNAACADMLTWFRKHISDDALAGISKDLHETEDEIRALEESLKKKAARLEKIGTGLHRHLLQRLAELNGAAVKDNEPLFVERQRGYASKCVVSSPSLAKAFEGGVAASLGEHVVAVPSSWAIERKVARALRPANIRAADVTCRPRSVIVCPTKKAYSLLSDETRGRFHIRLASELLKKTITLKPRTR